MKRKGFTLVELLVVIAIIALLMSILMPALARVRELAQRTVCGTNLSGIVKSMLVYSNDDENGRFPRAGFPHGCWTPKGRLDAWDGGTSLTKCEAFTGSPPPDGKPCPDSGEATVSSSLFLLARRRYTTAKQFVCKSDAGTTAWGGDAEYAWDFGDNPMDFCSYSYHMPYDDPATGRSFVLTPASDPGMAVVADKNPFTEPARTVRETILGDFNNNFNPDGNREVKQICNSESHQKDGQNVAYIDSHVDFEQYSFCGINDDNIYTIADIADIRIGTPPPIDPPTGDCWEIGPISKVDSFLVNDYRR